MLGIALINKQQGGTSHDVVSQLRRKLSIKRIGHAGTLDPMASGLLVMAVGPATRFLQYLSLEPKEYIATYTFGIATNTYDAEGEITEQRPVPENLEDQIRGALPKFLGSIEQIPPMYSAVKKGGKPLYVYARKGETIEREPRKVFLSVYELLSLQDNQASFRIVCSGGTYVRTLAHDLGENLGCGAHVSQLQRTRIGRFSIEDAVMADAITGDDLIPLADALSPLPMIRLNLGQSTAIQHGQAIRPASEIPTEFVGLLNDEGQIIGIGRSVGDFVQPECVIPVEALEPSV